MEGQHLVLTLLASKLSSDDKVLSSLVKKTCRTFLNHSREANGNNYPPCFYRIDFVVIFPEIEFPCFNKYGLEIDGVCKDAALGFLKSKVF